ncbi:MAG: NrpR regulatory domain-containing protein [Thermodesulfobacteriota bacterium]
MNEKTEKKELAILRLLGKADGPVTSSRLMGNLQAMGYEVSERTIRHYFKELDSRGLTDNFGKRGRCITEKGLCELRDARVFDKVGFLSAKIDQLTYQMNFDLARKTGTVIANISIVDGRLLRDLLPLISQIYESGYGMGSLMALFGPGEKAGELVVPDGMVGMGTVCSITLNGVLLARGIPTHSSFGGLLEICDGKPSRFVEIIKYEGTSLDPLEIFIKGGMTSALAAVETGNGRIGVGFRELPADSRDTVLKLNKKLERAGLGSFMMVGWPGQPLLEVPVNEGRIGAIVIGGLNPAAALEETGVRVGSRALAGMIEYEKLFHFAEMKERLNAL